MILFQLDTFLPGKLERFALCHRSPFLEFSTADLMSSNMFLLKPFSSLGRFQSLCCVGAEWVQSHYYGEHPASTTLCTNNQSTTDPWVLLELGSYNVSGSEFINQSTRLPFVWDQPQAHGCFTLIGTIKCLIYWHVCMLLNIQLRLMGIFNLRYRPSGTKVLHKWNSWLADGKRISARRSPESWGFILWGSQTSVTSCMRIHRESEQRVST